MIKRNLRNIVAKHLNDHPNKIKVVSFDVYDTILMRMIPSEDVTPLAAKKLSESVYEKTSVHISTEDILKSRADFKFRKEKAKRDWTVSQWLKKLGHEKDFNSELLHSLGRKAEIDAEAQSLRIANGVIKMINTIKKYGHKVIATSDTWLDKEWLIDLLKYFGLEFDAVFSSGSIKASKERGIIFKKIENIFNLKPENFLHIGDNLETDFIRARLAGWKAAWTPRIHHSLPVWIPKPLQKGPLTIKPFKEIINILKIAPARQDTSIYFQLAYNYLSPLLIIFSLVQWRRFREQKIEAVFYIARDAKIMFEVYNILSDYLPGSCPRYYIRLSRRAIALSHPDNLLQNVIPLPGKMGKKTVGEWLSNFTINPALSNKILNYAGLTEKSKFTEFERKGLRKACKRFQTDINDNQIDQISMIQDYFKQCTGEPFPKRIGIVDSGWACTIQDILNRALVKSELISGMYFGVSHQGHSPDTRSLKYGLLRDDYRNLRYHNPIESSAGVVRLWDTLLREPAGTVVRLERKENNRVEPNLEKLHVIGNIEKSASKEIIKGVRQGTLDRIQWVCLLAELIGNRPEKDFEMAATDISEMITTRPSRKIAKAFLGLGFDEGTAAGSKGSLGLEGTKNGVAWYPGILSAAGLKCLMPIMKVLVEAAILAKNKHLSSS